MAADAVTVRCPSCSRTWAIARRPDGTFPKTARCASYRGGCGRTVKVPRRASSPRSAARSAPSPSAAVAEWNPPSEPRDHCATDWTCSDCHAPVRTEPRGTALWCSGCGESLTPPAVLAPYQRGTEVTRAAKSQRERDLEALALARRKGTMGAQLAALADDGKLTDDSAAVVAWFAEQVKAAASAARLDELVELFAEAGIRRRRFWQGRPAAITAGYDDEDDDEGQDDEPARLHAVPDDDRRGPQRTAWAEALASCPSWHLAPGGNTCQLVDSGIRCGRPTAHTAGDGNWICGYHHSELSRVIMVMDGERRKAV
jgi:hypothetical protein